MNIKQLTQSENLVLQAVLSMAGSALIATLSAAIQYITSGGVINPSVLLSILVATFAASYGNSLKQYVPDHAKDLIQTYYDATRQAQGDAAYWREQALAAKTPAPVVVAPVPPAEIIPTGPAPVETAANPLQGTDFASLIAPTNPQITAVTPSK